MWKTLCLDLKPQTLEVGLEWKEHIWRSKYKTVYNKKHICLDTQNLQSGNPWAMESFEKRSSVFGLERWMRLGKKEARSSWQGEHQWIGIRIKGSVSSLYSAGLVLCQRLDGILQGWQPSLLLLELLHTSYCWQNEGKPGLQHMLTLAIFMPGDILRGCHYPYLKSMPCWQSCFLELRWRRYHESHVALPWKSWWETSARLVTHMEPGIGRKKFGMAHSGSQLIELQINHKHKMQIPVLFQGCLSQDKFKGLKEFLPLGKGREGGDYVGENMAILHFFLQGPSCGKRICRSKQKQRETRLV